MLSIENLEKELKNGKLESLYLFYGEERFLLESNLKKIKKQFGEMIKGINFVIIEDTNCNELIANMETPSFGYEKKFILAKNTGLFQKEAKRKNTEMANLKERVNKYLKQNIDLIKESVTLVFVEEEVDQKQELYKTIDHLGIICKFDEQKPVQIASRLKGICNAYQVQIEDTTLKYLIECSRNQSARVDK